MPAGRVQDVNWPGSKCRHAGSRMPTGGEATGTREEHDHERRKIRLGALHRTAFLCSVLALAIAAPAIADDSGDSKDSKKRGNPACDGNSRSSTRTETDAFPKKSALRPATSATRTANRGIRRRRRRGPFQGRASCGQQEALRSATSRKFDADGDGKPLQSGRTRCSPCNEATGAPCIEKFDHRRRREDFRSGKTCSPCSAHKDACVEKLDTDGDGKLSGRGKATGQGGAAKEHVEHRGRGPRDRPAIRSARWRTAGALITDEEMQRDPRLARKTLRRA